MKRSFVQLGVAALSAVSFSLCFATSIKHVYGLEYAKNYNSRTNGSAYIQAAAFSNKSNAERYKRTIQPRTPHPVTISRKNKLYLVLIGPMNSTLELRKTATALLNPPSPRSIGRKNRVQMQPAKSIKRNPTPKQSNKVLTLEQRNSVQSPVLNRNANWFITAGAGAEFPTAKGNISINNGSFFPAPYDTDTYTTNQSSSALVIVMAGRRWERESKWIPAFSLGVLYQHSFLDTVKGTVSQYSLPEYTNYNYYWDLSSDIVLASAKLNLYAQNRFSPYITAGLGGAFNHSSYSEEALPDVTPRLSPDFSGNNNQFAYNVGAGIDFRASNNCIINVGYLYQNLGDISAQGSGAWSDTSFGLRTYGLNEVLASATYLFDN